jgi:transcription initiation factor IIE alpha subunit
MATRLTAIETDQVSLEVYACYCGYHYSFDASYVEQVDETVCFTCPSCGTVHQPHEI